MAGFDANWLASYEERTGKHGKVQAGAGARFKAFEEPADGPRTPVEVDPAWPRMSLSPDSNEVPKVDTPDLSAITGMRDIELGKVPASVTLVLPYPPSGNHYKEPQIITPAGKKPFIHWYLTTEADEFKAQVKRRAYMAGLRKPFPWRVVVEGWLYPNRPADWEKRARKDPDGWDDTVMCLDVADNTPKVTLDALQGVAYTNDKLIRRSTFERMEPDGKGARLIVKITPIARVKVQESLL